MAYQKGKGKRKNQSREKNYVPGDIINEVSDVFNNESLLARNPSPEKIKEKTKDAWSKAIRRCKEAKVSEKIISEISTNIENAFLHNEPDQWLDTVNAVLDEHRRNADVVNTKGYNDIFKMWHEIANDKGERKFDIPWLRHISHAEKLDPYASKGERYFFKGLINQMSIAVAAEMNGKNQSSVVVNKTELIPLITHDFKKDPESSVPEEKQKKDFAFSKLKGRKTLTSIYVPQKVEQWLKPDRRPWRGPNGEKRPNTQQIESEDLTRRDSLYFTPSIVWSASDLRDLFSEEVRKKLDELEQLRKPKSAIMIDPEQKDLDAIIDNLIEKKIEQQSITVSNHGSKAFYTPLKDTMAIPQKEQFKNPVLRYAVFSHEMAHSTKHILDRPMTDGFGSASYAREEMVAETCAHLMVKDLEETLTQARDGNLPEDFKKFFDDYYKNAVTYAKGWGEKIDFSEQFDNMLKEGRDNPKSRILDETISDIVEAKKLMTSGVYQGNEITEELREEAMKASLEKESAKRSAERDIGSGKTPEP